MLTGRLTKPVIDREIATREMQSVDLLKQMDETKRTYCQLQKRISDGMKDMAHYRAELRKVSNGDALQEKIDNLAYEIDVAKGDILHIKETSMPDMIRDRLALQKEIESLR